MDQHLIQSTRYLLQSRFRRIQTAKTGHFEIICKQVLTWLEGHPILSSVLQHLRSVPGEHHDEIRLMVSNSDSMSGGRYYVLAVKNDQRNESEPEFRGYTPATFEEHASACLDILNATIEIPNLEFYNLLAVYLTQEEYSIRTTNKSSLETIKEIAVHDIYKYLDESLDGINAVNGLLQKYKSHVEWFQRQRLREIERGYEGKTGERALALHLQQYIFDQSVEFIVEPSSVSGEVDLLLRDASGGYAIIDAKYIVPDSSPSVIKRKIAEGFNQVARYCNDYNQPEGFLAVFNNDDISILIEVEQDAGYNFFKIGGHIIYYIEINIADRPSASKAGKARQLTLTADELIEQIEELQENPNSN